ncbi:hypothetical protein I3843_15G056800 [Carya illinoinensis]|uniref:Apple domain-containing protein n=1 Tax=Carya illinoinensis TaxID=32201 RepID=A0A8T1N9B6_CARIL|nr:uncharacterized protein LOC122297742 isoform X1 [Carya illinoinensis]KAG2666403.1 hypothetical protein I3760_15G058900 [Carya illinoinensis]KAG6626602.1 hypothetical protein CIPAW_15G061600 [Carya illinoinensis]KAG6674735.1 hypothetical protein I3842_15G059700 [Carya illinoinensis]KAG7943712.1 hypothetical protein I3843_15G056800 [Carya illinoinensis]
MAQGRLRCGCSHRKTTLLVCSINIVIALYVLRFLYSSLYIYTGNVSRNIVNYTPDQIRKMEESIRIRRAFEPLKLVKLVKELEEELSRGEVVVELSRPLKQKITDEILERLRSLDAGANVTEQREAVERWRREKLEVAKQLTFERGTLNSTIPHEEGGMLVRALESDWALLSEEIGLWMAAEVINKEHDDKPEGEEELEDQILPGRPIPPECHAELHADYSGAAVRWGLTHHKESAADCCQACLDHAKLAKPGEKRCNIWVYCPSETGCHSPDIYEHKHQECWLKYAEKPKLNFKDKYTESYRNSHPTAPLVVPWVSGVVSS